MDSNAFWVGTMGTDLLLVYDPMSQVEGSEFVVLWNGTARTLELYLAKILREHVHRVSSEAEAAGVRSRYSAWLATSKPLLDEQRAYLFERLEQDRRETAEKQERAIRETAEQEERERLARMTPAERHALFMKERGYADLGVRPRDGTMWRRVTHCYSCKSKLDNSIDVECVACGWIVCGCGACGCGFGL